MDPFTYPATTHVRRHGPQGYAEVSSYRPWLRDEFSFRCVYCLLREQWGRVRGTFDLDHFLPVSSHLTESLAYDNLLYCCATCNAAKGAERVPDPAQVLLASDVLMNDEGILQARTSAARKLIRVLGLNDPEYVEFRLLWVGIIELARRHAPELHRRLIRYPKDLPNLGRLRPPGGNGRVAGIRESYWSRREAGELPEAY